MNYREAWANGEIEAGTLVDAIEDQARELERQKMNCLNLLQQLEDLKVQPSGVVLPDGWVQLTIEHEPGYPEAVAFGPQRMMDRLKKWLDRYFEMRLNSPPVSAGEPVYQFQCREIGEGDWEPCDHSRYMYCQKSPEMDTRVVQVQALSAPSHGEQVLEGWQLVPVEPTREMISAASGAITTPDDLPPVGVGGWSMSDLAFRSRYRAAIAAAPSPAPAVRMCATMQRPVSECGCPDCGSSLIDCCGLSCEPCGGCGESDEKRRCFGCLHDFKPAALRGNGGE